MKTLYSIEDNFEITFIYHLMAVELASVTHAIKDKQFIVRFIVAVL